MRLVARILGVMGALCVPAVVMLFGCEVDETRPPGLPNEVPNNRGTPYTPIPMSGASGSSGSSSSGGGTAAATICDVAASLDVTADQTCITCGAGAVSTGSPCEGAYTACMNDPGCATAQQCLNGCTAADASATCVEDCMVPDQPLIDLMTCFFATCSSSCGQATPVVCDKLAMTDGGTNG